MIDLYKVGINPYEDPNIYVGKLTAFAEQHAALVLADSIAAAVALELTAVSNSLAELDVDLGNETVKFGLRKARVAAKNEFRAELPNQISRVYGAPLIAYGQASPEMLAIFPEGREVFTTADDSLLETKLFALDEAMTTRAAELDAAAVALATTLYNNWQAIYGNVNAAKGGTVNAAEARRQGASTLRIALGKLRLRIGIELFGQIERLKSLFPQNLLGFPLEEAPLPGALQIITATAENATTARIEFAPSGAENATEIVLQWKLGASSLWENEIPATRPVQLLSDPSFEQATVEFRCVTRNASGETISAEVSVAF